MTPTDLTITHVETLVEALAMSADFMSLPQPYKTQEQQQTFRLSASTCREIQASLQAAGTHLTLTAGRVAMMRAALTCAATLMREDEILDPLGRLTPQAIASARAALASSSIQA
ncbi:hypothetical protein [Deinococcus soli (ex Cha et al. 2016)]|uniref:Uncharacterized protein n=1 Tax=Deinococcus soli (ex Cha et al. 2016) TaxID=1309411 RepID=A0ACC6KNQ3_9DEIO|nr:hypothetical protein [Deinococcus soli (ex Cha et al. 2016)]MDR6330678.1 hypothetical protein [Deinococcus soli (ex Cha et al. 2016)]MDR6754045.1 hypothetical protein [Deinococcus soli (ex Cha et al. 2016)]